MGFGTAKGCLFVFNYTKYGSGMVLDFLGLVRNVAFYFNWCSVTVIHNFSFGYIIIPRSYALSLSEFALLWTNRYHGKNKDSKVDSNLKSFLAEKILLTE